MALRAKKASVEIGRYGELIAGERGGASRWIVRGPLVGGISHA